MDFTGQARPLTAAGIKAAVAAVGATEAHIWAVLKVETGGFGFLPDRRPQILFERHWFHRLTDGRFTGKAPENISSPKTRGYLGGALEYDRLEKALALDETAALKATSWGLPQMMGFNHDKAGYATPQAMVQAFCASEDAHVVAMARFIAADKTMAAALRSGAWAGFAERYNGPSYRKNLYDSKMAEAYATAQRRTPDLELRAAQAGLTFLGFGPGTVDGLAGAKTKGAVADFQRSRSLPATGILDDVTAAAIDDAAWPKPVTPAAVPAARKPAPYVPWLAWLAQALLGK